jgi:hypothetical protein
LDMHTHLDASRTMSAWSTRRNMDHAANGPQEQLVTIITIMTTDREHLECVKLF